MTQPDAPYWGDNIARLLGMHRLSAKEAAPRIGVHRQQISEWMNGHAGPSLTAVVGVEQFFGIPATRLMLQPFGQLLDLAGDPQRWQDVEKKIRRPSAKERKLINQTRTLDGRRRRGNLKEVT